MKLWKIRKADRTQLQAMCNRGISPLVAQVLAARPSLMEEGASFLGEEAVFYDPFLLPDMEKAVARLERAIAEQEKIAVYGDFDCDGITSTVVLCSYLETRGARILYYIPDRNEEGYGLNSEAILSLKEQGVSLIVTVDNGIAAVKEAAYAEQIGVDLLITDHHEAQQTLPVACAVLDPKRPDSSYPCRSLAGVGVVFKLLCAMEEDPELILDCYGDLIALGTIADVVELTGENRFITKIGLAKLAHTQNVGLQALMDQAGVDPQLLSARQVSFSLAPRINACGRLGDASDGVELLLTEDLDEALSLVRQMEAFNQKRQKLEEEILTEIENQIATNPSCLYPRILLFWGEDWHLGVIGIVAAKLAERFSKPCILFSKEGEEWRGSGRSCGAFSLIQALQAVAPYLERFGGHQQAAGLTVSEQNRKAFLKALQSYAQETYPQMPPSILWIDACVPLAQLNLSNVRQLAQLEPCGQGNEPPIFGVARAVVEGIIPLSGGKHCKLTIVANGQKAQVLWFHKTMEEIPFGIGEEVDLALEASINRYHETESVSLKVKDMRKSGLPYGEVYGESCLLDRFFSGEDLLLPERRALCPTREQVAQVYRLLRAQKERVWTPEGLFNQVREKGVSFGKAMVSVQVLAERGLMKGTLTKERISLSPVPQAQKVDLQASPYLQRLQIDED